MSYKWSHTQCDLLRLAFSLSRMPLTSIPVVCVGSCLLFAAKEQSGRHHNICSEAFVDGKYWVLLFFLLTLPVSVFF